MNPACHIIIADDDDSLRALLVRIVERTYPLAIITAVADGVTAHRVYQQRGADLLITDHAMPHGSGLELVQALRAQAMLTPIVLLSSDPSIGPHAIAAGATGFITKPFRVADLVQTLTTILPRQAEAGAP